MKNKITGFTCGSFDLLHAGHVLMIKECKEYCDYLIVGLQTDPSVDRKEKNKPVQSFEERLIVLESIKWVDEVIKYDTEEELYQILNNMWEMEKINIRIVGEDWKNKKFTGCDLPIDVVFNSRKHNFSTTELRKRVYQSELVKKN